MKKFKKAVSVILTLLLLFSTLTLLIGAEELSQPEDPETETITGLEEEPEFTEKPTIAPSPAPIPDDIEVIESEYGGIYAMVLPNVEDIPQKYGEDHLGLDLSAPESSPVVSADDGAVIAVQELDRYTVKILHPDGTTTLYANLASVSVQVDNDVVRGQVIGRIGTAPLHLEIIMENGFKVNPRHLIMPVYTLAEWTDVNAVLETSGYYGIKGAPTTVTFGKIDAEILVRYVEGPSGDSMVAYCIQFGTETNYPRNYKQGSIVDMYGQERADIIGDILAVGFSGNGGTLWNNDNCSKWAATQMALWEITRDGVTADNWHTTQSAKDVDIILGYTPRPAVARALYAEIIEKVLAKNKKPSFDGDTITLNWDGNKYTASVTDTNGVLSSFGNYSASGLTFTKSGNTLTISSASPFTSVITATATKNTDWGGGDAAIAWVGRTDSSLQWIASYSRAYSKSVTSSIKVKTDALFDISLTKTSANVSITSGNSNYSLNGAVYNVYQGKTASGTVVATFTTDSNGKASLSTKLPNGTYAVKEKTAPKGYVLDPTVYVVTISNGNVTLNVEDDPSVVQLTVRKKDSATGTAVPQGDASLAGAVYSVTYKQNGSNVTVTGTTNSSGVVRFSDIPLGTISVKETKAPTGYKLDPNTYTYTVTSSQVTSAVYLLEPEDDFLEDVLQNSITIRKKAEMPDSSTDAEPYAQFQVYLKSAGSYAAAKDTERDLITTDSDGKATTKLLPYGVYTVHQVSGSAGRELASDFDVTINQDTSTAASYSVDVVNKQKLGSLQIQKSSEDGTINGLQFKITRNIDDWSKIVTTDSSGKVTVSDLPVYEDIAGTKLIQYTVTEINTPERYEPPAAQTVTLTSGATATVKIENKLGKGSLKILKADQNGTTPLSGAVFRITDSNGNTIREYTTDTEGIVTVENLKVGTQYFYEEIQAPEGYKRDTNIYPFTLTANGQILEKTQVNIPSVGSIEIRKVDSSNNAMSGVAFLLEYTLDDGTSWQAVTSRDPASAVTLGGCTSTALKDGILSTGKDGIARFTGLQVTNARTPIRYRLTEIQTKGGQTLLTVPIEIELPPMDESEGPIVLQYTAVNNSIFELPKSGGYGYFFTVLGAFFIGCAVWVGFLRKITIKQN